MNRSSPDRTRGRRHGAAMMVWLFFANLFDPRAVAATEHVDTARRIGPDIRRGAAGRPGDGS